MTTEEMKEKVRELESLEDRIATLKRELAQEMNPGGYPWVKIDWGLLRTTLLPPEPIRRAL